MTWLSVVTVVKDDSLGFAESLASLSLQDLTDVEWVIVDSSTRKEEIPRILATMPSDLRVKYLHEVPRGIYSAMNSGIAQCGGVYAYFLNAGDFLFDPNVLSRVRQALELSPIWAHGPVEIRQPEGSTVITPEWDFDRERRRSFARGHFPAHQGTFARVDALRNAGCFDVSFQIAADYVMFLRLAQIASPVVLPFVVATFNSGGISSQKWQESFREFHRARRQILNPRGPAALRERWETWRQFALVYAHREIRSRLSWG